MKKYPTFCTKLLGIALTSAALIAADVVVAPFGSFISEAHAIVGRPFTPGSVAGVARRTTRRVVRRSTMYVAALPAGCARTSINGAAIWSCGGVYYQPSGGRYVVVYVD